MNGAVTSAKRWPAVELRELQVFLTVAEELHFSRAAERLRIDRSRVSQIINALEVKVGGRLFERTSRRVRLTPIGEQLVAELASPLGELQDVIVRAREAANGVAGVLRIGLYARVNAGPYMTEIVRTFTARHPDCEVEFVHTGFDRNYLDALTGGEVDMLATRLPLTTPEFTVGPILSREERVLVVAKDDPLAECESVSYEDIDRPVSESPAFPQEMMDAFVPPVTPSGRTVERTVTTSIEGLMMRLARGLQVHPTVGSFLAYLNHPDLASVPIHDLPPSETALVWLTGHPSPKIEAFVRAATDALAQTELAV